MGHLFDAAVRAIDDQRRDEVGAQGLEVDVVRHPSRVAGLTGIEDAALIPAAAPRGIDVTERAFHGLAGTVARITGTPVGTAGEAVTRDMAAGVGTLRRDPARRGVDRGRIAGLVEPARKIVPAKRMRHSEPVGAVTLQPEVKLAEDRALIAPLLEELGYRGLPRRNHGVGEVVGSERPVEFGAQGEAAREDDGSAHRTGGHRPGIVEAHACFGDPVNAWHRRVQGLRSAVTEGPELVDANVVGQNEQDVGRIGRGRFSRRMRRIGSTSRQGRDNRERRHDHG